MSDPTRILVVDEHTLFRESLVRLLDSEPDLHVAAHCASITAAREILSRIAADVVLLDYDFEAAAVASFLRELQQRADRIKVLVVTAGTSAAGTAEILRTGAAGVFYKHRGPAQLFEAIRKISIGELWLDSGAIRSLIAGARERAHEERRESSLSLRQRQVLSGVVDGLTNKEIAWRLHVSTSTAKAIVQELFERAGVRRRNQLVKVALQEHAGDWLAGEV